MRQIKLLRVVREDQSGRDDPHSIQVGKIFAFEAPVASVVIGRETAHPDLWRSGDKQETVPDVASGCANLPKVKNIAFEYYNAGDPARQGREEQPDALEQTSKWLGLAPDGVALELGCGHGGLATISRRYVGLDLGFVGLIDKKFRAVGGDMERLPLRDTSVAFIFSWAALEHVPHPELVLTEIERVLTPGGVAFLAPAWHCRPWAAEGLEFRAYRELRPLQRVRKALIPLRNSIVWRAPFEVLPRFGREIEAWRGKRLSFQYSCLQPNLTDYIGTDCDAFTSMDPHAAILYFSTRGWHVLSHPSRRARLLARSEPVIVQKPGRSR